MNSLEAVTESARLEVVILSNNSTSTVTTIEKDTVKTTGAEACFQETYRSSLGLSKNIRRHSPS